MGLTREEILQAAKPKASEVEIDGLGKVTVRQWTFREKRAFHEMLRSDDYQERAKAIPWAVGQCLLDRPDGSRLFPTEEDVQALAALSGEVIEALFEKIARFSDVDAGAIDRAGESSAETSTPA
jgi:hypothetical protein